MLKLKFSCYKNPFKQPFKTAHGLWEIREGIIINLEDKDGKIGCSEIAPLPWFGTETLEKALVFCQQQNQQINLDLINNIPNHLPCCQFAFQSALEDLYNNFESEINLNFNYSYLLPTGKAGLIFLQKNTPKENQTYKWKIGVNSVEYELDLFKQIISLLPVNTKLRLDANGGLNYEQACQWLGVTDDYHQVEFIEQILPPSELNSLFFLAKKYQTILALDESIANLSQLQYCFEQGWQGVFVIKPLIFGYPNKLKEFCIKNKIDVVLSSVLETNIGRKIALNLANKIQNPNRAIGFGINHFYENRKLQI